MLSGYMNLKPDRLEQTVTHGGIARYAQGSWTLNRTGDIALSKSFIRNTGEGVREDETASTVGGAGARIQIEIEVNPKMGVPTLPKEAFHFVEVKRVMRFRGCASITAHSETE